jgi:hypothetical protein
MTTTQLQTLYNKARAKQKDAQNQAEFTKYTKMCIRLARAINNKY